MKCLCDNRLAPLTFDIGFLECELVDAAEAFRRWRGDSLGNKLRIAELRGRLETLLPRLEPLTIPFCRELLVKTNSRWIARFDNGVHGGDNFPPISHLCTFMKCRGMIAGWSPDKLHGHKRQAPGTYGSVSLELYGPEEKEYTEKEGIMMNATRVLTAANDGGRWVFINAGEPLPFEQTESYRAKRIKDRFTVEMLESYCKELGVDLFNDEFYGPEAVLIDDETACGYVNTTRTLKAARAYLGLE